MKNPPLLKILLATLCLTALARGAPVPAATALRTGLAARPSVYPKKPADAGAVFLVKERFSALHGDGSADDSAVLQAAIGQAAGAGLLYVPSGTYRLEKTVFIPRGIRVIGYGATKPVFILPARTPGYAEGDGKYLFHFVQSYTNGRAVDGTDGTLFSGLMNAAIRIEEGNPAAYAVRAHFAQHSYLRDIDFDVRGARGAVEEMGHMVDGCRFLGGKWGIRTGRTSAGWQALVTDCEFLGQEEGGIETHMAGMTVVRCRFEGMPYGVSYPQVQTSHLNLEQNDKIYIKDSRFVHVTQAAIWANKYYDPLTQINVENTEGEDTPVFLSFAQFQAAFSSVPADRIKNMGAGPVYRVKQLSHGLHITIAPGGAGGAAEPVRKVSMEMEQEAIAALTPMEKDFVELPAQDKWINVRDVGVKGDGTTDDTQALRKAIADGEAGGGAALYFPTGTYRISDTLTLGAKTRLIGMQPTSTRLTLANGAAGFGDPANPKAMLVAAQGTPAIVGLAIAQAGAGSVGVKWTAGAKSYMEDVNFVNGGGAGGAARGRGAGGGILYGLWITDGGAGTFRGVWSPNATARYGLYISNTSNEGHMYEMSVEHHLAVEVRLENVQNWKLYALQTEEMGGNEKTVAVELENCKNVMLANLFMYHYSANTASAPYGIRVKDSTGIAICGCFNFSGGAFPFDNTLFDEDSGKWVMAHEFAELRIR